MRQNSQSNQNSQPTRVYHVRRDAFDVYVGRTLHGPRSGSGTNYRDEGWGNPFPASRDRQGALRAYRDWIAKQPRLLARLHELRGKRLGCWCAPKGGLDADLNGRVCHGQILAALADALPDQPADDEGRDDEDAGADPTRAS